MHTHRLNHQEHAHVLRQNRKDPVSGDALKEGDEVVFCASCSSAFLADSWEYMGGQHCNQSETLRFAPELPTEKIVLRPGKSSSAEVQLLWNLPYESTRYQFLRAGLKGVAILTDYIFIPMLLIFLIDWCYEIFGAYSGDSFSVSVLFILLYLSFRDFLPGGRSLGKRLMGLTIVHENTEEASIAQRIGRNLFSFCLLLFFLSGFVFSAIEDIFVLPIILVGLASFVTPVLAQRSLGSVLTRTSVVPRAELEMWRKRKRFRL